MKEETSDILDSKVSLHDRERFEIKLDIDLASGARSAYEVEAYFFVPKALNIGPATFTREDFYNNMQRHVRFQTPRISLSKLALPSNEASPLNRLRRGLGSVLAGSKDPSLIDSLYNDFKLLGAVARGEMRDYVAFFRRGLAAHAGSDPGGDKRFFLAESLESFTADLKLLIKSVNDMKADVLSPAVPQRLRDTFAFFDEYFSLIIEEYATALVSAIRGAGRLRERFSAAENELAEIVVWQGRYRKAMGYPSVVTEGGDNEALLYRRGVLKKFISSVLYLKTEISELEGVTQLFFGLAAGLAMLFAVLVTVYAQSRFAFNSAQFVVILVVSYIFKDRLKDWLKAAFSRHMAGWLSDREIKILDPMSGRRIGSLKEAFSFIRPEAVPPEVARLRKIDNITSIDEDGKPERVFKYDKEIILFPGRVAGGGLRTGVKDLMRFNVRSFTLQADDPVADYPVVDPETRAVKVIKCPRVYHMNVVFRHAWRDQAGAPKVHYDRVRIVLDKNGIVRLEEVRLA